mgnify:CR=1 FL=1
MRLQYFYNISALLLLLSCSVHDVKTDYDAMMKAEKKFSKTGKSSFNERWWTEFGDQKLNEQVSSSLNSNLDLKSFAQKVRQLQLLSEQYRASL